MSTTAALLWSYEKRRLHRIGKYWEGKPIEETRQHFANRHIRAFQIAQRELTWAEILHAFRYYGQQYDAGVRE